MPYKISGTSNDNARIYVLQNGVTRGYTDDNYGNYEVVFDADTPSGVTVVSENPDGESESYGQLEAVYTSNDVNIIGGMGATLSGITTFTASLSAVASVTWSQYINPDKDIVVLNGFYSNDASLINSRGYIEVLGDNSLRATRYGSANLCIIAGSIFHFSSGIKSIQRGLINIADGFFSGSDSLTTPVNMNRSAVFWLGEIGNAAGTEMNRGLSYVAFATDDGTDYLSVSANRGGRHNSTVMTTAYQVVEFY